jgi:Uma2 family endonuclease
MARQGDDAMTAQPEQYLTPEDYLALERKAQTKSEYYDGQVYALAGASESHALIVTNLVLILGTQLRDRPCRVYSSDLRVKVTAAGLYTYPNVVVVCGAAEFEDDRRDTLLNPSVLVEILSPSTESYDRGRKFEFYRGLDSLTDYILVAQDHPLVEHFARLPDGTWLLSAFGDLNEVARIESIGCDLPLTEVFAKVEFPPDEELAMLRRVKEDDASYAPR